MSTHAGYIFAAYAFTGLVVSALIVWSLSGYRRQRRALEDIETRLGRSE